MKVALVYILLHVACVVRAVPSGQKIPGSVYEEKFMGAVGNIIASIFADLEATQPKIEKLNQDCEVKVNATIEKCQVCSKAKCGPGNPNLPKFLAKWALNFGKEQAKMIGLKIKSVAVGFKNLFKNMGLGIKGGAIKTLDDTKRWFLKGFAKLGPILDKMKRLGVGATDWGKGLLKGMGNFGKGAWNWLKDLKDKFPFGRRRRRETKPVPLKPEVRRCFSGKCKAECGVFLDQDTAQDNICGAKVARQTEAFLESAYDLTQIIEAINTTDPILLGIWYTEDRNEDITAFQALVNGKKPYLIPTKKLQLFPRWASKKTRNKFFGTLATDYYVRFASELTRPKDTTA